jgi:hypothetical protein
MADKLVTVMTFNHSFEAQLAKNLLENEGIVSMVTGELSADVLLGTGLGYQQLTLQVREEDAPRATALLAEVTLHENWEEQAESGSGVWICSICGEPVSNNLSICYSCQTPREGIRTAVPRDPTAIQQEPAKPPTGKEVQKRDEIADVPSPVPSLPAPLPAPVLAEAENEEMPLTAAGDELALRALLASLSLFLLPLAWYYLLRVVLFDMPMGAKGIRNLSAAWFLNGLYLFVVLFVCAGGLISP